MGNLKKGITTLTCSIFLFLFLMCAISLLSIQQLQGDAKLINYIGIVRGGTQQLVKQEMMGVENDGLIEKLDNIMSALLKQESDLNIESPDDDGFEKRMIKNNQAWERIKTEIFLLRQSGEPHKLFQLSEDYFEMVNETVFYAEEYSREKVKKLTGIVILTTIFAGLSGILAVISYGASKKKMQRLAFLDEVTGGGNSKYFMMEAMELLKKNRDKKYAIIMADIDGFSYFNNMHGYASGNMLLKEIYCIANAYISKDELFVRKNNDHYVMLLEFTDEIMLVKRLSKLWSSINGTDDYITKIHQFTFSTGIYVIGDHIEDLNYMMDCANLARKKNKGIHENSFDIYGKELSLKMEYKQEIESKMQYALEHKEFALYLQPQLDFKNGKFTRAEALVRWLRPEKGLVPPNDFIPIFEENGFILQLDLYMFEEVCKNIQRWIKSGFEPPVISVNLSRLHLREHDLVERLERIAVKYDVPQKSIELELTESAAVDNIDILLGLLQKFHLKGFMLAIDDFGTGYSSMSLLKDYSFDVLKIDKSLTDDADSDERAKILITKVVELAKELKFVVVVEGVETSRQADYLKKIGCDFAQGFYYSRPVPLSEFEKLMFASGIVVKQEVIYD